MTEVSVLQKEVGSKTPEVLGVLKPQIELDQVGFKRNTYLLNGITFSFRGREELPIIKTPVGTQKRLIGSKPLHIEKTEFEKYQQNVQSFKEGPLHLIATKDLQGVLSLALELGGDPKLKTILSDVRKGIYSGYALDLMDQLIACNFVSNDDPPAWLGNGNDLFGSGAEAIVVLSLLGNNDARNYIDEKLTQMSNLDKDRGKKLEEERKGRLRESRLNLNTEGARPADPEKITCVHATRYLPVDLGNGNLGVRTRFDATGVLRNTLHVSLDRKVESHMGGHWDEMPYTVLSRFSDMLKVNDVPLALNSVDTWWVRNPGELLVFPSAHMVMPGAPEDTFEISGDRTIYKAGGYSREDIIFLLNLAEGMDKEESKKLRLRIRNVFIDSLKDNMGLAEAKLLMEFLAPGETPNSDGWSILYNHENFAEMISKSETESIGETIRSLFLAVGINKTEAEMTVLCTRIEKYIDRKLKGVINELAIKETIKLIKGPVEDTGSLSDLGVKLKIPYLWATAHINSSHHFINKRHSYFIYLAKGGEDKRVSESGAFDWTKYSPSYFWGQEDPQTRRMIYVSGAFNSRT